MLADVQTPFLGAPLVPLREAMRSAAAETLGDPVERKQAHPTATHIYLTSFAVNHRGSAIVLESVLCNLFARGCVDFFSRSRRAAVS